MSTHDADSRAVRLTALVRRVRRSFVATVLTAGLLLALAVALGWVVAGVVADLVLPLSVTGRQLVWCGWWAAVAVACGTFLVAPAMRWPLIDGMALRIERVIGDAHNQLLTVVDLARRRGSPTVLHGPDGRVLRPDMVERLLDQTQERLRGFRSSRVLPWRALVRNTAIAAAAAGCIAMLCVGLGDRFFITLQRLLDPRSDIPPATWLQLHSPGDLDVLEGDPLEIRGRVVRGDVDAVSLVIYDAAGRPSRQPMRSDENGDFVAVLDGLDHRARYRLEGGNTWTRTHEIAILQRPEIRSLACRIRLPAYMRVDAPLAVVADSPRIEAPEGATVQFEIAASAEAASGTVRLCERSIERDTVERFDDRVWFEDDLPRDAVSDGPWKWTTTHAAGGLRSFALAADGGSLAMRTRLEPLVLPREQPDSRAFSLMARLDAKNPPTRLTVLLEHGQSKTEVLWGDASGTQPPAGAGRIVAGPLPTPGDWARLTAAMKSLGNVAGQPVTAATFSIDRGRALLDRPSWTERSEDVVSRAVDHPVGEIPLVASAAHDQTLPRGALGSDGGTWAADVPVTKPMWVTAEVRSDHGHANLPMQPIEIAPTVDLPPSIVVDAMPETLVLKVADDVPLTGRGFDDWGIDEISVLVGPDPARLAVRETLPGASPADRPPQTQVSIVTALSPEMLGIAAGKSAMWKLRIRDTKGQTTESKLFRVTVLTPPESDLAKTQVPALAQARREAAQLARETARKAEEADAKREAVRDALAAEETPAKRVVDELAARLDRERRLADNLATTVKKAAEQAASSDLVPREQQEMLAELAQEARSLERSLTGIPQQKPADQAAANRDAAQDPEPKDDRRSPPEKPSDAAKAERIAEAPRQSDTTQAAAALADALEGLEQRLNAQGAALQIDALAKDLARRADQLVDSGKSQPEAGQTRQQVRDIEQILGRRPPTPQAPPQPSDPTAARAAPAQPAADQPAAVPKDDATERAASPATVTPATAAAPDATAKADGAPAEASAPSKAIAAAADAASAMAASAASLAARLTAATPTPTPPTPPSPAESPAAAPAENLRGLLEGDEVRQALAMAERARRLQAKAAAQAEAAARAEAAGRRTRDGKKPAAPRDDAASRSDASTADGDASAAGDRSDGGAMSGKIEIDSADALRGLDARQRAAVYKLPPHIRDPLLEGMRQRGPAAYQGVIDTYFRQLGKDIPQ